MAEHYLLWASGEDQPGIVASVSKALFQLGANLEDSSMMRLGSEFGIFLIFTTPRRIADNKLEAAFAGIRRRMKLALGVKKLSRSQAESRPPSDRLYLVSVHGPDRPGIVYRATELLAKHGFNVTDLSTHRTTRGPRAGYILLIEGELPSVRALPRLRRDLARIQRRLKTRVDIRPVSTDPF